MPAEKYRVELTEEERGELISVVKRGKGGAAQVRRANILLAVDVGEHSDLKMSEAEAARAYRASAKTVFNLKKKLVTEGFDGVLERKRRKAPGNVKVDGELEAKMIAIACTDAPGPRPLDRAAHSRQARGARLRGVHMPRDGGEPS